jgi:hypothetical protein
MTGDGHNEGEDDSPVRDIDSPGHRNERSRQDGNGNCAKETNDEGNLEALEDLGNLFPEVGALDFLLGCSPGDVIGEHMGEDGNGNVDAETTKEEEAVVETSVGEQSEKA